MQNVFFLKIKSKTIGKYLRKLAKNLQKHKKKVIIVVAIKKDNMGKLKRLIFTEECKMAVKKATVDSTMAKVEAAAKKAVADDKKAPAKKAPAKKVAEKKEAPAKVVAEKKEAPAKAAEKKEVAKKAPAKKAPAKKAATKKAAEVKVIVEYAGGQMDTADIAAMTLEKLAKAPKSLNVYYQPETNMVYYTADGEEGSFSL